MSHMSKEIARAPHRATREVVRRAGSPEARVIYAAFGVYNRAYFKRKLASPLVLITYTGRALGDYAPTDPHGLQSRIRINPSAVERGERFYLDVLLHEMVHAWLQEVEHTDEAGYRGHGPRFAEVCNRIGAELDLPPVGVKSRDGLPPCIYWPMNVRPDGYYPEPFEAPKRVDKRHGADEAVGGDSADESAEESAPMPLPGKRALLGAGLVAGVLTPDFVRELFETKQDRANATALRRYLEQLASYGKGET